MRIQRITGAGDQDYALSCRLSLPLVEALMNTARAGKDITVVMELQARLMKPQILILLND